MKRWQGCDAAVVRKEKERLFPPCLWFETTHVSKFLDSMVKQRLVQEQSLLQVCKGSFASGCFLIPVPTNSGF